MPTSDLHRAIERLPFLHDAPEPVRSRFLHDARLVCVPAGHYVGTEGAQCSTMSIVISGSVRVFKVGETGREITLYRIEPGEGCILTASCILSDLAFPAHAVSEGEVEAVVIPARTFADWTAGFDVWRRYVYELLSRRLATVIAVIDEVTFRRLDARLAGYLLTAAADASPPVLHTTHEAIAAELGSSREVVSRVLKDFERTGVVTLARGTVTVRRPAELARIAESRVT